MPTTTYLLIAINVLVSLLAFSRMNSPDGGRMFFFSPSEIAAGRNYEGMFLSHFSHGDGTHLLFNMVTLYSFGPTTEAGLGPMKMLLVYVASGILSNLVLYYRHRMDPNYRALGASDSITGILFAAIVLLPGSSVYLLMIPVEIPAPVFAVAYILLSTFFMKRGGGNVSHEAHLAGAFVGLVLGGLLGPEGFVPLLRRIGWMLS
jgi:membrane associated rhomboid family serine protease